MGTATSVLGLKCIRTGLGLTEGPCPVGLASTINNWFPPKEKATATGVYIAATMFAPILVPPLAVWIAMTGAGAGSSSPLRSGWSLPSCGICWYAPKPSESAFVSKAELETITAGQETPDARRENIVISPGFARLDRLIRVRELAPVSTVKGLFTSKNILGDCPPIL